MTDVTGAPFGKLRFRIHPCFWLVVILAVWGGYFVEIATLFALVIIHELGHVSAARYFRWRMTEVELLPFGGVAKTDEWGTVPAREEILVAIAGPAYNGAMIVFGAICYVSGLWTPDWSRYFVTANLWLGGFNLLPVYPLDGGRILQALLSYKWPYRACIVWTLRLSVAAAAVMVVVSFAPALFGAPPLVNLLLLALFLLLANVRMWRKKEYQFMRFLAQRLVQTNEVCKQCILLTSTEETLWSVVKKLKKEECHVIVVRDCHGDIRRILTEETVLRHLFGPASPHSTLGELP
ncbi:M50 family metallopeptidase [Numidum massiliense]|uniref:M50 family metallopeptidase n=1 Tax=Numidum massiliense TaxID=1522315 RepID=UPI00093F351E|nr:M50 family metallopeptidase [Numidum massiliense]